MSTYLTCEVDELLSLAAAAISEEVEDDEVVFVKTIEANEAKPRPYAVAVAAASLAQKLRGVFSASSHGQYSSMYEPPLSPLPSRATAAADTEQMHTEPSRPNQANEEASPTTPADDDAYVSVEEADDVPRATMVLNDGVII